MKKFSPHFCLSTLQDIVLYVLLLLCLLIQILPVATKPSQGSWGLLHYYLGAKYLPELGYFDLYRCLIATQTSEPRPNYPVRELHNYAFVDAQQLSPCPQQHFSAQRWQEFNQDSQLLIQRGEENFLSKVLTDKGFNPPPSWAAIAGPLANLLPLHNQWLSTVIFNLDLLFIMLTGLIVWQSCGYRLALITVILACGYFGSFAILGNNFLQYAWLPLLAGAVSAWRSQRPLLSGCLLACATGLQVFPGVFAIPIGLLLIISLCQKRYSLTRFSCLFFSTFITTLLFAFTIGLSYGKGINIWQEWYGKMSLHKSYLQGEVFDIGLPTLLGTALATPKKEGENYIQDYQPTRTRQLAFNQVFGSYLGICGAILFIIILALWRNPLQEPFGYGYFLLYLGLSLSPYYYLVLALAPFIFWQSRPPLRQFVLLACSLLFISHILLFWQVNYVSYIVWPHLVSQLSLASFYLVLLLLLLLYPRNAACKSSDSNSC